ncbi:MAG: TetR/AcrR family transcriptional regulator [Acidimicrobiales bacterium]
MDRALKTKEARRAPAGAKYTLRRQRVLEAAAKLFAEKGYEATSIGEIAESVGLLKGSLYYYAPSKEELLFSIIREVHEMGRNLVGRFTESDTDPATQLRDIIDAGATFVIEHREMNIISMRDFRALSEQRQAELESGRLVIWHYLRNLIARGCKEGYFRSDLDVVVATTAILGAINYLPTWYESGRPPRVDRMAQGYAEFLVEGLLVKAPPKATAKASSSKGSARA